MNPSILSVLALALSAIAAMADSSAGGSAPCPPTTELLVARGWSQYRADSISQASRTFTAARRLCAEHMDAVVGLGFASLRLGNPAKADGLFRLVVLRDSSNIDGWEGMALASSRLQHRASALHAARALLALAPGHPTARGVLDTESPGWDLAPRRQPVRPPAPRLDARTHGRGFEIRVAGEWKPFYIRGVNLGVALPGRFPAEFPADSSVYADWLGLISGMNANTIRVYTLLPPVFYRALADWNRSHPDRLLWLIHGVWTELPPEDDFDDPQWRDAFRTEMRRVVDVVHGACDIEPRPGHASGRYEADVSPWTLAYIIGREWEPYAIQRFDESHRGTRVFRGRFLEADEGAASEAWMAEQCDHMLGLEWDLHHSLRPIAYTNWPTLDPLHHPTESSASEERLWRDRAGRSVPAEKLEYENDGPQLDPSRVRATAANPAGWFASYHAYPYYPDFMNQDEAYSRARSGEGRSNYFGYLEELCRHHSGLPVVISEFGVPSSRGVAHLQAQGWDHGGHDEQQMAEIDARMTREIHESGAAGAIVFAWIDEWFKKNWAVMDLEIPGESNRLWHNAMDAEQNYGILAMVAGDSATTPRLGGDPRRWLAFPAIVSAEAEHAWSPRSVRLGSDEAYVYVAIELQHPSASMPWDSVGFAIAFDTIRPDLGQGRLDGLVAESEVGFEFLADLRDPAHAELRVTPDYNPYSSLGDDPHQDDRGRFFHRPAAPVGRRDGRFESLSMIANRARFARDGKYSPAQMTDRGRLRFGTREHSSLSDWYYDSDAGLLELRLPWALLNVTDPSSRRVLFDVDAGGDFGTCETEGFRVGVIAYRKAGPQRVLGALPPLRAGDRWARADFATWSWATWTEPRYHPVLKPVHEVMRRLWADPAQSSPREAAPPLGASEGR